MTCRECWEDPCECEPEPLEDFENGYCTELAPRWPEPRDWSERANAHPFCTRIWLDAMYKAGSAFEDLMMRNSPVMMRLGESVRPFVDAGSPLARLLPERPSATLSEQVNRGLQNVGFDEMANYSFRPASYLTLRPPIVVSPVEYAELERELRGVRTTPAEDALFRPSYDLRNEHWATNSWGGNRATRRARKAMKRARR